MAESDFLKVATGKGQTEWLEGIPPNKAQEWMSMASLQAIIAQAGLNMVFSEWDDGVDLLVGATKELPELPANHFISLQIKSTQKWRETNGNLHYFLKRDAWKKLKRRSKMREYLILYPLPQDRPKWFSALGSVAVLRHCPFFLPASSLPVTCNDSGITIEVPTSSLLTSHSLINLLYEAAASPQEVV